MSFLNTIDDFILGLDLDLEKVNKARVNGHHHASFVADRINRRVQAMLKETPNDQIRVLGTVLSKVSDDIVASFDHCDEVESNIHAAFNAYKNVRESYVVYKRKIDEKEMSLSGSESSFNPSEETIPEESENLHVHSSKIKGDQDRKLRKIGERPIDKLKERSKREIEE